MFHTVPTAQGSTHQICSKLYEKKEERGIDPSDCAQLFPRNSNRIPTETRPNQCSLCAHLLDFPSPLDTALSVPCNPGPASASSVDCRNLQVAFKKLSQQSQRIGTLNAERAIYIYIYEISGCGIRTWVPNLCMRGVKMVLQAHSASVFLSHITSVPLRIDLL